MRRSGGSLGQIPKSGHLQTRGFCVHPGSLTPSSESIHTLPDARRAAGSLPGAFECFFIFRSCHEDFRTF
nr:MAG TPA: hypothetical protein [Caudoviricetes sp.]